VTGPDDDHIIGRHERGLSPSVSVINVNFQFMKVNKV
jgi:hypothetical protein